MQLPCYSDVASGIHIRVLGEPLHGPSDLQQCHHVRYVVSLDTVAHVGGPEFGDPLEVLTRRAVIHLALAIDKLPSCGKDFCPIWYLGHRRHLVQDHFALPADPTLSGVIVMFEVEHVITIEL